MLAYSASGVSHISDLMGLDAHEVELLEEYALRGPSQARTQLLLAQLVQIVGGYMGNTQPMGKLLPWLGELTAKSNTAESRRMDFMERQRQAQAAEIHARVGGD